MKKVTDVYSGFVNLHRFDVCVGLSVSHRDIGIANKIIAHRKMQPFYTTTQTVFVVFAS